MVYKNVFRILSVSLKSVAIVSGTAYVVSRCDFQMKTANALFFSKPSSTSEAFDPNALGLFAKAGNFNLKQAMDYSDSKDRDAEKAYEYLSTFAADSKNNFELSWRLSRACVEYGDKCELDYKTSRMLYEKSEAYARNAIRLNPWSSLANLWLGISLSRMNSFENFFIRMRNSAIIKGHFERAVELNPADPLCHHMLGMWHYTIADYNMFGKMLAFIMFNGSTVLTSFHEALMKFEDAERVQPNFSIKNHLMLAKCYVRIGNYTSAKKWLYHILKMPGKTHEEQTVKQDASTLIEYMENI